jgi:hypothetical protein
MDYAALVTQVAFPIVGCIALAMFLKSIFEQNSERAKRFEEQAVTRDSKNDEMAKAREDKLMIVNEKVLETNRLLVESLSNINNKVDVGFLSINNRLDRMEESVSGGRVA